MKQAIPSSRKSVTLSDALWAAISAYRFANQVSTESEAIRRLLEKALAESKTPQ